MLQRITEKMEQWPVEDWAATAGRVFRRTKRRLARRRARVAIGAVFAVALVAVGGNALWSQRGTHPAPLWGETDPERVAIASHGGAATDVRVAEENAQNAEVDEQQLVAEVQEALAASGYFDDAIDGNLNEATEAAIRAFERDLGMAETGAATDELLLAITSAGGGGSGPEMAGPGVDMTTAMATPAAPREVAAAPAPRGETVPGSVAEIQRLLNERGFGPLTVDGQMGKRTRQALDQFASRAGLGERDGLSPEVLKALAAGA